MPNREKKRAAFALGKVYDPAIRDSSNRAKYRTWLVKLPTHLHVNGLGQTVAFYLADGPKTPKATICGWLDDWLVGEEGEVYTPAPGRPRTLIHEIMEGDDATYRRASAEARALSLWLKRFAEAFLREPEETSASRSAQPAGEG